jgi:large subunit ribosomal protein L18e
MVKPTGPSNALKRILARKLWQTKRRIWRDVSDRLMAPVKNRVEVNLYRLARVTKNGDTVVIPGKILGNGTLSTNITIACWSISSSAAQKITSSGSKVITIEELLEKNPTGSGVKIII